MATDLNRAPEFDDIVFEIRNKNYGAYALRKNYSRNVNISLVIGIIIVTSAIIAPYLNSRHQENTSEKDDRIVEINLLNLDTPLEKIALPPAPPPPAEVVEQHKYVPPVVVDSIKPEDNSQLMTADEAKTEVRNLLPVEVVPVARQEVLTDESEAAPFVIVEEMPMFPGGNAALLKYLQENAIYPELAEENNIQGRVILKFCVTPKGGVSMITILKGVDPELDAEAIRVVNTLPAFKPGKQGGKPVPVWFQAYINFQLK